MTRTIFLCTDGRHVTLGRSADHEPVDTVAAEVRALGHRGFIAVMSGDYYGGRGVKLSRGTAVDACPYEWDAAVTLFHKHRAAALIPCRKTVDAG